MDSRAVFVGEQDHPYHVWLAWFGGVGRLAGSLTSSMEKAESTLVVRSRRPAGPSPSRQPVLCPTSARRQPVRSGSRQRGDEATVAAVESGFVARH
jgi:hypothetical protein